MLPPEAADSQKKYSIIADKKSIRTQKKKIVGGVVTPPYKKEAAMFYFGVDYLILVLKRLVRMLQMAALMGTAVAIILAMMTAMCA